MTICVACLGLGNMGKALLHAFAQDKSYSLLGFDRNENKIKQLQEDIGLKKADSIQELAKMSDILILAVKPQHICAVLEDISKDLRPETVIVSIAAGISLDKLQIANNNKNALIRIMPNTPALVGLGVFAICATDKTNAQQKETTETLFNTAGKSYWLAESAFDGFTAVIGSGPAYVFYCMEALIESGVGLGLSRANATSMVKELFLGSAQMANTLPEHISELREMVTSPAGTTFEGLACLDKHNVRFAFIEATKRAYERSLELKGK